MESASAFSTHHVATLVGFGAHAVCPWLALETCRSWRKSPKVETAIQRGKMGDVSVEGVQVNFKNALNKGLKKILSKMGISLITSYQGAQIFECYGLGPEVINTAFKGTVSRIGGLTMDEVAAETHMFVQSAFPGEAEEMAKVEARGMFQVKPGLEYHGNNQEMSKLLHKAVGLGGGEKNDEFWSAYQAHRNDRPSRACAINSKSSLTANRSPSTRSNPSLTFARASARVVCLSVLSPKSATNLSPSR